MYILIAAKISIFKWVMHFLKDLMVCQLLLFLDVATIIGIMAMVKLWMLLMIKDEVMLFSLQLHIFKFFLWYESFVRPVIHHIILLLFISISVQTEHDLGIYCATGQSCHQHARLERRWHLYS